MQDLQQTKKGVVFFERIFSSAFKYQGLQLGRPLLAFIRRCRSNHIGLNHSLRKINIAESPQWVRDHEIQDLNHVVCQYEQFRTQRVRLFSKLCKIKRFPLYDIISHLTGPNVPALQLIYSYIKDCKLKI